MKHKRLPVYLAVLFCLLLINHMGKWFFMPYLLLLLFLMPLISLIYAISVKMTISASLEGVSETVERGKRAAWRLHLENKNPVRTAELYLSTPFYEGDNKLGFEYYLKLRPGKRAVFNLSCDTPHCGAVNLKECRVSVGDLFGFFTLPLKPLQPRAEEDTVWVLPASMNLPGFEIETEKIIETGSFGSKDSINQLDEIDRMRPMMSGDTLKTIHWKLSARMDDWYVKQFEKAEDRHVVFLIDLPDPEYYGSDYRETVLSLRDYILERTAALIPEFIEEGYAVSVKLYLAEVSKKDRIRTATDIEFLKKQLAMLPLQPLTDLNYQLDEELSTENRNLYYILTHEVRPETCDRLKILRDQSAGVYLDCVSSKVLCRDSEEERYLAYELAAAKIKMKKYLLAYRGEL